MSKSIPPPSINEPAFACPHCGAYANQMWASVGADKIARIPHFPDEAFVEQLQASLDAAKDPVKRKELAVELD